MAASLSSTTVGNITTARPGISWVGRPPRQGLLNDQSLYSWAQMPLNPFDASFHSFEEQVLPEVNRRGIGALGMKSMGATAWAIKNGILNAEELLRYAMSLAI